MPIESIALLTVAAVNCSLVLIVLSRNVRSQTNIYFAALAGSTALWATSLAFFLAVTSVEAMEWWSRLRYLGGIFIAVSFAIFAFDFNNERTLRFRWRLLLWLAPAALSTLLLFNGFLVSGVELVGAQRHVILDRPDFLVFITYFLTYFYGGHVVLLLRLRRAVGLLRTQLIYVLAGIFSAGAVAVAFNILLPLLFGFDQLVWVSPFLTLFANGMIFYAIVKHRLFDIRFVIARSVAYALLLATLGTLYVVSVFALSQTFLLSNNTTVTTQQTIYAVLAVILAFTFQPLRRFFEKVTDSIFYRDRYETHVVLGQISNVLAAEIDITAVTRQVLKLIGRYLKLENASFVVLSEGKIYSVEEYGRVTLKRLGRDQLKKLKRNLIVADEAASESLKTLLLDHRVAAALRLKTQDGVVGYLLLGSKSNGSIYTGQDINLLEILSRELAVSVENSLSFEQVSRFNITLQEKIRQATAKLRSTNAKLKELDRAKDEFISMASHQLRTPLTTVKGYLSMMLEGDGGQLKGDQHQFADAAYLSAQRMVYLIADMLNVSRISTGRLTFDIKEIDLVKLAKEEIDQLKRTASAKDVELHFNPPNEPLPPVQLDPGKIRQVMMNFMDNAIYYAPDTTVEISLDKQDDKIRFEVRDHGIGVPKKDQQKLFSKFYRAENAKQHRPDGTGLGLYMAKMVIEELGGQIIFESAKGRGSTFGFEFKLDDIAAEQSPAEPAKKSTQVSVKSS